MRILWKHLGIYGLLLIALSGCFGDRVAPSQDTRGVAAQKDDILTLSFVGDNVLGDYYGSNGETLNWYFTNKINKDYSYFFAKVKPILDKDDMTLGNLEGPLTTHSGDRLIKPLLLKATQAMWRFLKVGV
ncbi:CapA family protein, partial [Helicobacter japonicus]|uniref:CapA family protein n=1 Tax=Helicobacter japonicus TaxID=425400 RepID=UPI0030141991